MKIKTYIITMLLLVLIVSTGLALDLKWTTEIQMTPPSPKVGNSVEFKCKLRSNGGASSNVNVIARMDNVKIWSKMYPNLSKGEAVWVSFAWNATAGNHKLAMIINQGSNPDNDPTNNRKVLNFYVPQGTGTGDPGVLKPHVQAVPKDLLKPRSKTVFNIDPCLLGKPDVTPTDFRLKKKEGDNLFFAVKIKNLGTKCIKNLKYRMMEENGWAFVDDIPVIFSKWLLMANEEKEFTIIISRNSLVGVSMISNNFHIILDPADDLDELDEFNNSIGPRSFRLTIGP